MSWLSNFVRPKIKSIVKDDIADHLWRQCPSCSQMIFHRDLAENLDICPRCDYHFRISVDQRLNLLLDEGYNIIPLDAVPEDPLKFKDHKKYVDRLKDTRAKTKRQDALVIAHGYINGKEVVVAAFDFSFMGGSMGIAVGEGIVKAASLAIKHKCAFLTIPASGGARMQEGILSLMQMPRTTIAITEVQEAGLPYIVLLTDPTTGGVSASFAMLGDIHIAESGCMIGFAGRRVIEQTVREVLPEGFQTAEYLHEHGMVDIVAKRSELKEKLEKIIDLLTNKNLKS